VYPTADAIRAALVSVADDPMLEPGNFRLMGRHEFVQSLLRSQSGYNIDFAVPGPDKFAT
jgi:hypothetical protein